MSYSINSGQILEVDMAYIVIAVALIVVGIFYFSVKGKPAPARLPIRTTVSWRRKI
jgi:hypothetical protein